MLCTPRYALYAMRHQLSTAILDWLDNDWLNLVDHLAGVCKSLAQFSSRNPEIPTGWEPLVKWNE